jgi:hypothetical protein
MTEAENIRNVEQLDVDMIGFIFYPKSPRCLCEIPAYLPVRAKRVGVFVNESKETILMYADRFAEMHANYYTYEWTWAYEKMLDFYGLQADKITAADIAAIVRQWQEAVVGLDKMVYEDAKKEFSLTSMTGFGADGSSEEKVRDFEEVRGVFESNPFVTAVLEHIKVKTELGNELIERVKNLL